MSAATVITDGFGSFGNVAHIVTLGLSTGGVTVGRRPRRRFHVRREDKLFFFDTLYEAEQFALATQQIEEAPKKQKKKLIKKLRLIKPAETYSVKELVEQAPDDMREHAEAMIAKAQYEALMNWLTELEDDEEDVLLLLSLLGI